jgi:hypothetical protein
MSNSTPPQSRRPGPPTNVSVNAAGPAASKTPLPLSTSAEPTVADRVAGFYGQLSAAAAELNAVSDALGQTIVQLDAALKKLNLGISTWVVVVGDDDHNLNFWSHQLGYTKIDDRWGIALKTVSGNHGYPEEIEREEWFFNEAPRALRIEAIGEIPALLEQLIEDAQTTSQKIRAKVDYAGEIAVAIGKAAESAAQRK